MYKYGVNYYHLNRSGVKKQKHFVAHNGHAKGNQSHSTFLTIIFLFTESDKINMNGLIQRKRHPDITSSWRVCVI